MKVKNQKLRLVAAVGLCFFSVVAVVTATVAWFTAFRKSDDGNDGMKVHSPHGYFASMTLHSLTATGGIDYLNEEFHFKKTPDATATYNNTTGLVDYDPDPYNIVMSTYSDLDQHSPVLMLITLTSTISASPSNPVTVYAACDKDYYFGEKDANGEPTHAIQRNGNPLSSVVAFYSKGYTSLAGITEESYYNVPVAEWDDESGFERRTFVTFDEDEESPTYSEYQSFTQRKNIVEIDEGSVLYIAVIVDYYHYALEYVYNTFIGNTTLDETIYFSCDWNMVI